VKRSTVFVVEGKRDQARLIEALGEVVVVTTNGSETSQETINELKTLSLNNNIVIIVDPDGPGEKIRRKISSEVDGAKHVYLEKDKAISKSGKKVGLEHMSVDDVREAMKGIKVIRVGSDITRSDLFGFGLVGKSDSSKLRNRIALHLGFGYANAKTFLKKCLMFGVTKVDLEQIVRGKHDTL